MAGNIIDVRRKPVTTILLNCKSIHVFLNTYPHHHRHVNVTPRKEKQKQQSKSNSGKNKQANTKPNLLLH